MAIVSGYQKMKDYIKQSSGYKLLSRWANANTVECDDAQTVQSKIGGITGISSSLTANSSTQAASTQLTNQLYQNISKVNVYVGEDGKLHFVNSGGADSALPFNFIKSFTQTISWNGRWTNSGGTATESTVIDVPENTDVKRIIINFQTVDTAPGDNRGLWIETQYAEIASFVPNGSGTPPNINQDYVYDVSSNPGTITVRCLFGNARGSNWVFKLTVEFG